VSSAVMYRRSVSMIHTRFQMTGNNRSFVSTALMDGEQLKNETWRVRAKVSPATGDT
jgi:hypothetical protein